MLAKLNNRGGRRPRSPSGPVERRRKYGLSRDAADLLRGVTCGERVWQVLARVKEEKQAEYIKLMLSGALISAYHCRMLVVAGPAEHLKRGSKNLYTWGFTDAERGRLEKVWREIIVPYQAIESTYKNDMHDWVITRSYLACVLKNARIVQYIETFHADIATTFESINSNLEFPKL